MIFNRLLLICMGLWLAYFNGNSVYRVFIKYFGSSSAATNQKYRSVSSNGPMGVQRGITWLCCYLSAVRPGPAGKFRSWAQQRVNAIQPAATAAHSWFALGDKGLIMSSLCRIHFFGVRVIYSGSRLQNNLQRRQTILPELCWFIDGV